MLSAQELLGPRPAAQPDLVITGRCTVSPGTYYYGDVNIVQTYDGNGNVISSGELIFTETTNSTTNFWASSIIVENGGSLNAGVSDDGTAAPFGAEGGSLTFHIYGADRSGGDPIGRPGQGTVCVTRQAAAHNIGPCGIPQSIWDDKGKTPNLSLPGGVFDYFYQYGPLMYDTAAGMNGPGYFGYKVLAVSYGGKLKLRGFKGASGGAGAGTDPLNSGTSWLHLKDSTFLAGYYPSELPGAASLTLERPLEGDWKQGDQVVVTSTDYLPGHSEQLNIDTVTAATITFHRSDCPPAAGTDPSCPGLRWAHSGARYSLANRLKPADGRLNLDPQLMTEGAETRAAVALLTRSIRIVSEGDSAGQTFAQATAENPTYALGAHTVFRQGFAAVQIQGAEFYQMGQGGRIMHYPVHFHEARRTPADTYVDDSSVHDSMTRWYVIHSTQDVTLARNVGYLSIGHGYYLEDATETDNKFYSDIGIFARAAVDNVQNPRKVPGILADNGGSPAEPLRGTSDYNYPAVFWITNGWNEFEGNMAVGAGACGACYWLVPAFNSDARDVPNSGEHMSWSGYSALQQSIQFEGTTPLKTFYKNICTGAMNSFTTVSGVAPCFGVNSPDTSAPGFINAVKSIAPPPTTPDKIADDTYYPHFDTGGNRKATICPADPKDPAAHDCSTITVPCSNGSGTGNCGLTLVDHYTTSFNWADYNFSAIWLRPQWYLVDNSVISDVQNSGLTFVTGGDYTNASVIQGFWALASHSVFIGTTQPTNPFASDIGPFSSTSGLSCVYAVNHCRNVDEGVSIQLASFAVEQRLFSIYDGPNYQDSNAYLDILKEPCTSFVTCMYFNVPGVRKDPTNTTDPVPGYLPNAAIGWKQPNGFYYPPAFHSDNMFFNNVDIRHYVNIPLFEALSTNLATPEAGTYVTDQTEEMQQYINPGFTFSGMTDIDRQTVLNDDDGSLGGLGSTAALPETIMVNNDTFYSAPTETAECMSNVGVNPTTTSSTCPPAPTTPPTAVTSPYEYITTAISPACANSDGCGSYTGPVVCEDARCRQIPGRGGQWSSDCAGPYCFGARLFRQHLTGSNAGGGTREWQSWISNGCDDIANAAQARCQFPFIRMGTQNSWQRSAMTVNHGTFYIDTSISQHTQALSQFNDPSSGYFDCSIRATGACQPLSVNTFVGGQTYYVYFIYAKGTTHQVYQMYVGEGFDPDNMVQAIRMDIDTIPFKPKGGTIPWATTGWKREMITGADGKTDVLQVTVDFSTFAGELNPVNTDASGALTNPTCLPADFCAWNKTIKSCGCNLAPNDPRWVADPNLAASCSHACNVWAVKDLDCPPAGCLGFSVTMQPGFQAVDQYKRPKPQMFPTSNPLTDFTAMFKRTTVTPDSASGGTCYYGSLPNSCPNPN